MALGPAHDSVNARNELVLMEWLGQIIICPKTKTANLVVHAARP